MRDKFFESLFNCPRQLVNALSYFYSDHYTLELLIGQNCIVKTTINVFHSAEAANIHGGEYRQP
jgi:hypothetical protein